MKGGDKMNLEIKKITDKIEELDVHGQGCTDDCADWSGNKGSNPVGCVVTISPKGWSGW